MPLSHKIILQMPELGSANKRKIAAIAGLAPYNQDSGKKSGKKSIRGGRKILRNALYMVALLAKNTIYQ
jgi:transposase